MPILTVNSGKSFVPPHLACWKSLEPPSLVNPEIGIRHEGEAVSKMRFPHLLRQVNSDFHMAKWSRVEVSDWQIFILFYFSPILRCLQIIQT